MGYANIAGDYRKIPGLSSAHIPYSTSFRRELCIKNRHLLKYQEFQKLLHLHNKIKFLYLRKPLTSC